MNFTMDINAIKKILPHRYPILLVDRVIDIEKDVSIRGYKNITINEEIFLGHFPTRPIYPGVMIIEGMAQISGILACISIWGEEFVMSEDKVVYFASIDGVKFRIPVVPGDSLVYDVKIIRQRGTFWSLDAKAFVDEKLVCEAQFKIILTEANKAD